MLPDWSLPAEWRDWALAEFPGWDGARVEREAAKFRDYWCGAAGARGRKADWPATWRNWCRRSAEDDGRQRAGGAGLPGGRVAEAAAAIARARVARGEDPDVEGLMASVGWGRRTAADDDRPRAVCREEEDRWVDPDTLARMRLAVGMKP